MDNHPATALSSDPQRLLTPAETAEVLGLRSDRTLRTWARQGTGPRRLRVGGRFVRYRAADIVEWLNSRYTA
jgi:predicted DNA-binding transcriptional regulator AlpA